MNLVTLSLEQSWWNQQNTKFTTITSNNLPQKRAITYLCIYCSKYRIIERKSIMIKELHPLFLQLFVYRPAPNLKQFPPAKTFTVRMAKWSPEENCGMMPTNNNRGNGSAWCRFSFLKAGVVPDPGGQICISTFYDQSCWYCWLNLGNWTHCMKTNFNHCVHCWHPIISSIKSKLFHHHK